MAYFSIVYEDIIHSSILDRIFNYQNGMHSIYRRFSRGGNAYIRKNFNSFNTASNYGSYMILTDLDNYECPLALIANWNCDAINSQLIFCIAIKEAEAWLLADRYNFAKYFSISIKKLPIAPELIPDPKLKIIELARMSRKRVIKQGIVPRDTAKVGKDYNNILNDYIYNYWNIDNALNNSDSLRRVIRKLNNYNLL